MQKHHEIRKGFFAKMRRERRCRRKVAKHVLPNCLRKTHEINDRFIAQLPGEKKNGDECVVSLSGGKHYCWTCAMSRYPTAWGNECLRIRRWNRCSPVWGGEIITCENLTSVVGFFDCWLLRCRSCANLKRGHQVCGCMILQYCRNDP